jgi:hypothetical protein
MNENEQWVSLKMPSILTRQDKETLVALGARHNGVPYGKPGFGWEAPSSLHAAAQAVLSCAMTRQGNGNARSIARGMGRGAI